MCHFRIFMIESKLNISEWNLFSEEEKNWYCRYSNFTKELCVEIWNSLSEYQQNLLCGSCNMHYIILKYFRNTLTDKQLQIIELAKFYQRRCRVDDEQTKHRKKYKKIKLTNAGI